MSEETPPVIQTFPLLEALGTVEALRTPQQVALIEADAAKTAAIDAVKSELGDVYTDDNSREKLTNRLLLALLEGATPEPEDVAELRRVYDTADPIIEG